MERIARKEAAEEIVHPSSSCAKAIQTKTAAFPTFDFGPGIFQEIFRILGPHRPRGYSILQLLQAQLSTRRVILCQAASILPNGSSIPPPPPAT
ncbi:unnamed protein product [Acanthoscelides obtectus]|uniref:Uncharacterized protein n=1 Tax=Acanthoscelides obtectus TaxID=200917 RepID=A0A9P0P6T9_ACAOB|nr:unnamed protein product [Acanthoscelides obtectus]CAK1648172.1 hypothetical protein AOBTE_LOCUS15583 [Acanthoscelides obtectus]